MLPPKFGKFCLAGEYTEVQTENVATGERDAYMILADYDFNDKLGAAIRISGTEKAARLRDVDILTLAPNYQITESLGAILEFSDIDAGDDIEFYGVELTYTF